MSYGDADDPVTIRVSVRSKMVEWGIVDNPFDACKLLPPLFSLPDYEALKKAHYKNTYMQRIYKLLDGPHGLTVYKTLVAKHG